MHAPPTRLAFACLVVALCLPVRALHAGGVGVSEPADSVITDAVLRTSNANINEFPYHYYKVPQSRAPRANRDYEFLWSDTYQSRFARPLSTKSGPDSLTDMDRLGQSVCDLPRANPFAYNMTDIEIAYDYLASRDTLLDAQGQSFVRDTTYDSREFAPFGFRTAVRDYEDAERMHLDAYIYASSFPAYPQYPEWGSFNGDWSGAGSRKNFGLYPAEFVSSKEDSSTGHALEPLHGNSVTIPGPPPWGVAATHDYRWTGPRGNGNAGLVHESLHALNADGMKRGTSQDFLHMFASGAEVLAGVSEGRPYNDFDYTYSLTPDGSNAANAYPHWQSWMAWLAFNWRGADTTAAGWSDDLIKRWATRPWNERTLAGLVGRVRDSECAECASCPVFVGLDSLARLQRMLHDWRVAVYVNGPTLPGGRYGFPTAYGFSPYQSLWAWRGDTDGWAGDDTYSVPPVFAIGASQRNQELHFTERPGGLNFNSRPLRLNMFGAEYFVFKANESLTGTQQNLAVRVHMPGLLRGRSVTYPNNACRIVDYSGRLYASLVSYSHASDSLFIHPEWADSVQTKWAKLDQSNSPLVFEVPGFGASTQAVVLIVSLEDGPEGAHTMYGTRPQGASAELGPNTYDFEVSAVAHQEVLPHDPLPVASTSRPESTPSWSAGGDSVAFEAIDTNGHRGVFVAPALSTGSRRPVKSGTLAQYDPAWSPRDHSIAFAQASLPAGRRDLWQMTSGGAAQQLTDRAGAVHEPVFSPNGSQIAYFRYVRTTPPPEDTTSILPPGQQTWVSELRLLTLDGGGDDLLLTFAGDSTMSSLRWSPDGKRLFFRGTGEAVNEPWHLWQRNMITSRL